MNNLSRQENTVFMTTTAKKEKEKTSGIQTFEKPISELFEFYISGCIGPAEQYSELFHRIRNLSEMDFVKIHINSYGGDLFTGIQFMRVLRETQATVICSIEGACFSAATLIFLAGSQFEISPHSAFMVHNYSGLAIGKGGEMIDQLMHERKWSESLLRDAYTNFLTEEEIKSLLDNKDIWMDANDVVARLENKAKKIAEAKKKEEKKSKK